MEEKSNNISLQDINNCQSLTPNDRKIAELYFIQNKSPEEIVAEFEKEGSMQVSSVQRVAHYIQRVERKIAHYKVQNDISFDTVYREIAKKALMSWNGLSEEEATKVVMESSNEELESKVGAQGSIDYALEGIKNWGNNLARKRSNSSITIAMNDADMEDIKFVIMNASKTSRAFGEFKRKNLWPGHDYEGDLETGLALAALESIHDGWVKDNQKKFMARDDKFQHMPIELIGWEEVKKDLLFLSPILETMGIMPVEEELEKAYDERAKSFFEERGITSIDELTELISKGADFYPALEGQDTIIEKLEDPKFVSERVIPSIKEKGVGADKSAMEAIGQLRLAETISMKAVVTNSIKNGITSEEVQNAEREELETEQIKEGVEVDD